MEEPPSRDDLLIAFSKERSIRRTLRVLRAKRSRIQDDLNQLITHLTLLVPRSKEQKKSKEYSLEIIVEALSRLEDDGFVQLLNQAIIKGDRHNK